MVSLCRLFFSQPVACFVGKCCGRIFKLLHQKMLLFFLNFLSAVRVLEKDYRQNPFEGLNTTLHGKNEFFIFDVDVSEEMFVSEA